ncbi:hypothetical protein M0R04_08120 [Candidatus Dojkabacteria bacterium]|jgi:hypothetical protein|nr:hypothetical protein [Candidatus Dojkabacteria bacterium]
MQFHYNGKNNVIVVVAKNLNHAEEIIRTQCPTAFCILMKEKIKVNDLVRA